MAREALNWSNVTSNSAPTSEAQELYADMALAMDKFEEYFQNNAPKGKRVVFSYRKGNNGLTVGIALANGVKPAGRIDWLPSK